MSYHIWYVGASRPSVYFDYWCIQLSLWLWLWLCYYIMSIDYCIMSIWLWLCFYWLLTIDVGQGPRKGGVFASRRHREACPTSLLTGCRGQRKHRQWPVACGGLPRSSLVQFLFNIYIYIYIHTYICVHIYIEREREREMYINSCYCFSRTTIFKQTRSRRGGPFLYITPALRYTMPANRCVVLPSTANIYTYTPII